MWKTPRSRLITATAVAALVSLSACGESGSTSEGEEEFPTRAMTIVGPYGAGGFVDLSTRLLSPAWGEAIGQEFTNIEVSGAGGELGTVHALEQPADGYTLLAHTTDAFGNIAGQISDRVDIDDFLPLGVYWAAPYALAVNADAPWQTIEDFLDALKDPSESETVAVIPSSLQHGQWLELFDNLGVTEDAVRFVEYSGSGDQRTAIAGGHVQATITAISGYESIIDDVRVLVVFDEKNPAPEVYHDAPAWPDVEGIPDMRLFGQTGTILVRSELADEYPERYERLVETFADTVQGDAYKKAMADSGFAAWVDFREADEAEKLIQGSADAMADFVERF